MPVSEWIQGRVFNFVHLRNLVYNTCWEDPRLDREALQLQPHDEVVMITSAGCNALDYALDGPAHVYAIDMNPAQNALLELKQAGIRQLDYTEFFQVFGRGHHPCFPELYQQLLRPNLSPTAQAYWDRHHGFFSNKRSFYFRGTSGFFAKMINLYIDRLVHLRSDLMQLLNASSVEEQAAIYFGGLRDAFWSKPVRWAVGRDTTLSLVGVPRAQREQVEAFHHGGIAQFIEDAVEAVFTQLPLRDNYFWRVYLTGEYSIDCCPEYLKLDNFLRLKAGLVDRISSHTMTVTQFLLQHDRPVSKFVLLDHMDWLSSHRIDWLQDEWQVIVDRATSDAQFLWRSGGLRTEFLDELEIELHGQRRALGLALDYDRQLAGRLHQVDRVHTYGSFHIAKLNS